MKDIHFRAWHSPENKMYHRGYQKWLHVLLCEDDHGENDGRGRPVKRARYADCVLLESAGVLDKNHREVYEGDIVRVLYKEKTFVDVVDSVPDMFGSRKLHPLAPLLKRHGIPGSLENLDIEILGNEYENPDLLPR
ncbi:MAG: hypothetical protein HYT89_03470 [Candidatus Omnitrophica bacterium]|nr:hypothetical protein [Candidatus Omnitrophota bacterium]